MSPAAIDRILARIDAIVGAPEDETDEEHEARRRMVVRDHDARRIRRGLPPADPKKPSPLSAFPGGGGFFAS